MRWTTPILIRWSDLDAYGHVNNVSLAEYLQEARTRLFREPEWDSTLTLAENDALTIVAHQELEYRSQVAFRAEPLLVDVWVTRAVGASLELGFEIVNQTRTESYLVGTNLITLVPRGSSTPRRLTETEKAAGAHFAGEPVKFRRQRRREH